MFFLVWQWPDSEDLASKGFFGGRHPLTLRRRPLDCDRTQLWGPTRLLWIYYSLWIYCCLLDLLLDLFACCSAQWSVDEGPPKMVTGQMTSPDTHMTPWVHQHKTFTRRGWRRVAQQSWYSPEGQWNSSVMPMVLSHAVSSLYIS